MSIGLNHPAWPLLSLRIIRQLLLADFSLWCILLENAVVFIERYPPVMLGYLTSESCRSVHPIGWRLEILALHQGFLVLDVSDVEEVTFAQKETVKVSSSHPVVALRNHFRLICCMVSL